MHLKTQPSDTLKNMNIFPKTIKSKAPPIKSQGIKTKLAPFVMENIKWNGKGRWVEPFLGSGAVLLNAQPERALVSDTNKHIIDHFADYPCLTYDHFYHVGSTEALRNPMEEALIVSPQSLAIQDRLHRKVSWN